ncbi:hypothetical protein [Lichenifustis flavocetrariae]|uniref:Uncharacterized protein n=1 Tax=Lichenifustis flavocetrariae TaxID=2949735 RepID=A0AA42CRM7_9HYPH|nr:hypothetical protein [Lichenifustis flavocetrariae]MCW6512635.1 hypothetical protein [Lichenifustis flavocetrariae]
MKMRRIGDSHTQSESRYNPIGKDAVELTFLSFGAGQQRSSGFDLEFGWTDVEALLSAFASQGHSEAIRIKNARVLATAVEALVQNSN